MTEEDALLSVLIWMYHWHNMYNAPHLSVPHKDVIAAVVLSLQGVAPPQAPKAAISEPAPVAAARGRGRGRGRGPKAEPKPPAVRGKKRAAS